jgi:hypothetical protein
MSSTDMFVVFEESEFQSFPIENKRSRIQTRSTHECLTGPGYTLIPRVMSNDEIKSAICLR